MKRIDNRNAFFLLEAMLTVIILSVGLVFVIRSITASLGVARQALNHSKAIRFVDEKASEIGLAPEPHALGPGERREGNGVFESDNNFRWAYVVEKSGDDNITSLAVDVSWKDGKREGNIGIATYLPPCYNVTE